MDGLLSVPPLLPSFRIVNFILYGFMDGLVTETLEEGWDKVDDEMEEEERVDSPFVDGTVVGAISFVLSPVPLFGRGGAIIKEGDPSGRVFGTVFIADVEEGTIGNGTILLLVLLFPTISIVFGVPTVFRTKEISSSRIFDRLARGTEFSVGLWGEVIVTGCAAKEE